MSESLAGKTVFVTGATGFIGSRLIERLITVEKAHVKALVHNPGRAVRIARLPVELVFADILNASAIEQAVAGCQIIFHCAYGNAGDTSIQYRVNVEGTKNVLHAAVKYSVERFVHVSTIAVHGLNPGDYVDETAPYYCDENDVYGSSKLEAEKLAWAGYHEHDLPVVIIRPTIVYGPASQYWTIYPVQRLLAGGFYLIEDGQGVCNPVYVDDLVRALTLAATHPAAIGEAFFITSQPVTWRQFFGYYIQMAGVQQQVPSWDITTWNERHSEQNILKTPLGKAKSYLAADRPRWLAHKFLPTRVALRLFDKVAPGFKERVMSESNRLYRARRWPVTLPDEREMIQFSSRCVYSVKKAAELLNYEPVVSLDKGMTRTKDWLHYVGLLNA